MRTARCLAGLICALAWPCAASAQVVGPGDSIQAAVDAARPGETITVHGTHRENVAVQTDRVALRGRGAVLLPPATPSPHACFDPTEPGEAVHGVCVVGDVDFASGEVSRYVHGVSVVGFTIRGFAGAGLVAVGARDTTFRRNVVVDNDDGIMASSSIGTRVLANDAAGARFGARVFSSARTTIVGNRLHDNCVGVLVLGAAHGSRLSGNGVRHNTRACPPDEDFDALSGIGVGLLGATGTATTGNRITGNVPGGDSAVSGGVVAMSAPDGTPLTDNLVRGNLVRGNEPDVLWDGTGTGNVFGPNLCSTSAPAGLCPAALSSVASLR